MIKTPFLRFIAAVAGAVLTAISVRLTYLFGYSISFEMAVALGLVSFMAGYILPIAYESIQNASSEWKRFVVPAAAVVAVLITAADILSNASTIGYNKTVDQTTVSETNRKNQLVAFELKRAEDGMEQYKKLVADLEAANPWISTVSAQGIKDQISNMEGDYLYKRSIQCGDVTAKDSRAFCDKLTELRARHATAMKRNEAQEKLETAREVLSQKQEQAMLRTNIVSAVAEQNTRLATLFTVSRNPTEDATYWTDTWLMVLFGFIITAAAQFFNFVSWAGALPGIKTKEVADTAEALVAAQRSAAPAQGDMDARALMGKLTSTFKGSPPPAKSAAVALEPTLGKAQTEPLNSITVVERYLSDKSFAKDAVDALKAFRRPRIAGPLAEAA